MRYRYEYDGEIYEIMLERLPDGRVRARIGERDYTLSASPTGEGTWLINHEGEQHRLYVASAGEDRYIQMKGEHYHLVRQGVRRKKAGTGGGAGDMTAQMPSQIMEVLVQEGDQVMSGQALIVLEAMKMEIRVTANVDGIIKRVLVEVGQIVERGQVLIEVAPTAP